MQNKTGHSFKTKKIISKRIDHKMPSTSNNIESKHGHLNEITPRNNTFLGSIHRLNSINLIEI